MISWLEWSHDFRNLGCSGQISVAIALSIESLEQGPDLWPLRGGALSPDVTMRKEVCG